MSDEMSKLERTLQRATALQGVKGAQSAPQSEADPQEATLREAWLAFGRLLDAAAASAPPQRPLTLPECPRAVSRAARRRRRLWATVSIVVAASLLIVAVAVETSKRAAQKPIASRPPQKTIPASAAVLPAPAKTKPSAGASALAADVHQSASLAKTSSWDDAVDTQITQVGRQMALVEQDWRAQADSLDMVQYRLKSVEQEVSEGKF
jgi:hypothetical protein